MHGELTSPSSAAEQEASSASASVLAGRAVPPVSVGLGAGAIARAASSKDANKELNKRLGKKGTLFGISTKAKPHTKKGTGKGGDDSHSKRDGAVSKKAAQDYLFNTGASSAIFSASSMRVAEKADEKKERAEDFQAEKAASKKQSREEWLIAEYGSQEDYDEAPNKKKYIKELEAIDADMQAALAESQE